MEPSDESTSKNQVAASFDSEQASSSKGRNQVLDTAEATSRSNAAASPTCLCGHRPTSASSEQHPSTAAPAPPPAIISLTVAPTTGGQFELKVSKLESIDNLKKTISKRLKVPKERICLLWKDRHLRDGTLREHGVCDGSRLTLLPSVETGLLTQRPEQSVMQALESLNDGQVNDFLSGKAPLNLTMRLGDHMMLIQLQLSAVAPTTSSSSSSSSAHRRPAVSHQPSSSSSSRSSASSTSAAAPGLSAMLNTPLRTSSSATTAATAATPSTTRSPSPSLLAAAAKAASHPTPPVVKTEKVATPTPSTSSSSSSSSTLPSTPSVCGISGCLGCEACETTRPVLDTRALAEASRNLTQTLKQLSSEVLTSRSTNESSGRSRRRQGAIIESMHHHGKGVYSGTFSGTLNPALQDRQGRPKRDISTIIHILNDLLCATPQYRRVLSAHAAAAAAAAAAATTPSTTPVPSSGSAKPSTSSSVPMEQDEAADLVAASATAAAAHMAAALHRKTPGKAGLPTLLLLREETRRLAEENQATRGKLEQLRVVMEERRARRRARREARAAPYSAAWSAKNGAAAGSGLANSALAGAGCGFQQQHQSQQQHASAPGGSLDCSDSSMDTSDGVAAELVRELNTEPVVA